MLAETCFVDSGFKNFQSVSGSDIFRQHVPDINNSSEKTVLPLIVKIGFDIGNLKRMPA